ncbi:MAG TPA: hypothetical protein VFV35_01990 [Acidimicrobiales bacterium]|nr:hypothetical protein [Acidimicrobiales bacterium]
MVVVYLLVALGLAFAIAAIAIGREARRLDAEPPRPVFDPDEAVEYVANHLPFDIAAVLSHADVKQILDWNLEFLRSKGVSGNGSGPHVDAPIVIGGAETVAYVLDKAAAAGADYGPRQVEAVLEAQMAYLEAIGAIGPEAPPDNL